MAVIFAIFTAIILFLLWTKWHFTYWKRKGLPQINGTFPFGSLVGVGVHMCNTEKYDSFYRLFKREEKVVGFYNFLSPAVLVLSPDVAKTILVKEFPSFHSRGLFYNSKDDPISTNLLTLEGQEWKERRTKMTHIFSSGKIKMMFEILDQIGNQLVDILGSNMGNQDVRIWAQKYTSDTIGNVAFGIECGCLQNPDSEFLKYGKRLFELKPHEVLKILFASEMPELGRKLGFRFTPKESAEFFLNTFLETLKFREKTEIDRNDFVSLLLKMKETYSTTELAAEAFLIYTGGFETSSTLITYTLYELALNPDIQERLRDEITTGIDENDGKLTYDLLFGFKYLDMVINESLRKYPPLPNVFRKCTKDFIVPESDFTISKGTSVIINTYSFHRDPQYFPEPEKFNPERFSDENIEEIKPFTFLAFGDGQRGCIGERFGKMQSKIAITKLIKNFKFSPCDMTSIPVKYKPSSPFIEPKNGMWLNIEKVL